MFVAGGSVMAALLPPPEQYLFLRLYYMGDVELKNSKNN